MGDDFLNDLGAAASKMARNSVTGKAYTIIHGISLLTKNKNFGFSSMVTLFSYIQLMFNVNHDDDINDLLKIPFAVLKKIRWAEKIHKHSEKEISDIITITNILYGIINNKEIFNEMLKKKHGSKYNNIAERSKINQTKEIIKHNSGFIKRLLLKSTNLNTGSLDMDKLKEIM